LPSAAPPPAPTSDLELFEAIFLKTLRVVESTGAKFVFVNIPAQGTLCDGVEHQWKSPLLDFVARTGVDIINLETDYRNLITKIGREAVFAVPPCGGHFSEIGYKVIGDRLVQYLDLKEKTGNDEGPQAGQLPLGCTYRPFSTESGRVSSGRRVRVAKTVVPYDGYIGFESRLETETGAVARDAGAAILGGSAAQRSPGAAFRITARFSAYSVNDNEVAAALFVGDEATTRHFAVKPVTAGTATTVEVIRDLHDLLPGEIEFRVGSHGPGKLIMNGDERGPSESADKPSLTFEEFAVADQLVCAGAALSDAEVTQARRAAARRLQRQKGSLEWVGTWFDATKSKVNHMFRMSELLNFHYDYAAHVGIDRPIEDSGEEIIDTEGAAIMGYSFTPKAVGDIIKVTATVPAWSATDNRVTAALFKNQDPAAVAVGSQPVAAGTSAAAKVDFEISAPNTQPISFSVRVGPAMAGVIYLNGTMDGPSLAGPKPALSIQEFKPLWR
jgi:Pgp3 C-terminal domain